jgi:N-succinyl-L-ornithine transcarbamylase
LRDITVVAYCWFIDKDKDNAETVLAGFLKYATAPIVNMEGCTGHPFKPWQMP